MENVHTSSPDTDDRRIDAYDLIYGSFDASLTAAGGQFADPELRRALAENLSLTADDFITNEHGRSLNDYYTSSVATFTSCGMNERTARAWTAEFLITLGSSPEEISFISSASDQ